MRTQPASTHPARARPGLLAAARPGVRAGARPAARPGVLAAILVAVLAACGPLPPPTAPAAPDATPTQRLAAVVDSILGTPPHHRTHWGILVHDAATGRQVYGLNEERNFTPASNMKLITGAVALAELGEGYRYRTPFVATGAAPAAPAAPAAGAAPGDTVAGALVVRGRGDPTLSARFHDTRFAALDSLADSVAVRGIRRFRDGLVVDATWQTDAPLHFAWFLGNLPFTAAAGTAAFGIEEGTLRMVLHPGATVGATVHVELLPFPDVADVQIRVVTGPADERRQIATERRLPGDTLIVEGTVPLGAAPDTLVVAAPDPAELAARSLAGALRARGIRLDGPTRVVRDTAELRLLLGDAGDPLLTWTSPPMAEIVVAFMLPSQNWIAEQLVKTVGAQVVPEMAVEVAVEDAADRPLGVAVAAEVAPEGSWAAGIDVHARYLEERVGLDPTAFFLRDGSGLSNQSLITPAGVVALLEHARRQPWFASFLASLPRPGQQGGTLAGRLQGLEDRVAAKTGTITHVNGLSGYIDSATGRTLTFSIFTNATGVPAAGVREAMDRIVREIADW